MIAKDILSIQNVTFCVNFATCQNKNRKFVIINLKTKEIKSIDVKGDKAKPKNDKPK